MGRINELLILSLREKLTIMQELQEPFGSPKARRQLSKTQFVKGLLKESTTETIKESLDGSNHVRIVTEQEIRSSKGFCL
jgi:hypothetical protein